MTANDFTSSLSQWKQAMTEFNEYLHTLPWKAQNKYRKRKKVNGGELFPSPQATTRKVISVCLTIIDGYFRLGLAWVLKARCQKINNVRAFPLYLNWEKPGKNLFAFIPTTMTYIIINMK